MARIQSHRAVRAWFGTGLAVAIAVAAASGCGRPEPAPSDVATPDTVGVIVEVDPHVGGSYTVALSDGSSAGFERSDELTTAPPNPGSLLVAGDRAGRRWVVIVPPSGDVFLLFAEGWDSGDRIAVAAGRSRDPTWISLPKAASFSTPAPPEDGHYLSPTAHFTLNAAGEIVSFDR